MRRAVRWHWFRPVRPGVDRCAFLTCGRPAEDHWQLIDEWMLPRHERWRRIAVRAIGRLR